MSDDDTFLLPPGVDPVGEGNSQELPRQNWEAVLLHAERWRRASNGSEEWRRRAMECVDFYEGKQWKEADLAALEAQKRPHLTINKIAPLVNLVQGYQINNISTINYLPSNDGSGTSETAAALSHVSKAISQEQQIKFKDIEVFMDGLLTGRGYWDMRMCFDENIYGKIKVRAADNFAVYLDPEAMDYDINSGAFCSTTRWVSADEVGHFYGKQAHNLVAPLAGGATWSSMPMGIYEGMEEVSPWRTFGGDENNSLLAQANYFYDWVDPYRKTVRLLDTQHYVRTHRWFFVDLDTGDQNVVPDHFTADQVRKAIDFCQRHLGQRLTVMNRPTRRLRWTHMVGDIIVFDEWSPYDTFTIVPFFPYFRRGQTKGMVDNLVDVQREINTRRSARMNIIGRQSNGGWKIQKGSLSPQMRTALETEGSRPGFILEWDSKGGTLNEPKPIELGMNPLSHAELEKEANSDILEVAGINKAALGQLDQAMTSGRSLMARQQQTVIGLEGFTLNYHRAKDLFGRKQLELIQRFYTTQKLIRVMGSNTSNPVEMIVNEVIAGGIKNNLSIGRYTVDIAETSGWQSFLAGQFEELLKMKEMGMPIPDDWIIDASSVPRKEELRTQLAAERQAQTAMAAAGVQPGPVQGAGPGGSRRGADGGSMPKGGEPGAPMAGVLKPNPGPGA